MQGTGKAQSQLIAFLRYSELGQSVTKTMGMGRLVQPVDYAYHIRGWLTRLNDPYQPRAQKSAPFRARRGNTSGRRYAHRVTVRLTFVPYF